jgi:DNA-binding transcriptional ArsR family regulator
MFLPNPNRELPDHFLALANPTRLRILERLGTVGEEGVNDLAQHLHMSQPRISWHLRMLRLGGVIRTRRGGRSVYCSLDVDNIRRYRQRLDEMLGISQPHVAKPKVREEVGA